MYSNYLSAGFYIVCFIITDDEEDLWSKQIWSMGSKIRSIVPEDLFVCTFIWPICNASVNSLEVYEQVD